MNAEGDTGIQLSSNELSYIKQMGKLVKPILVTFYFVLENIFFINMLLNVNIHLTSCCYM